MKPQVVEVTNPRRMDENEIPADFREMLRDHTKRETKRMIAKYALTVVGTIIIVGVGLALLAQVERN